MRFPYLVSLSACALMLALPLLAQSPNGVINGLVVDPSNRVIVGADAVVVNDVTGVQYTTKTNDEGIYVLPNLPPGPYRLQVSKIGFKTLIKPDIILNVQDALAINFTLPVGALSETVTVEGGAPLVNTESATVSTVVDRQFAENLPMNGRSFQSLIQLAPGVVMTQSTSTDSGQFSVNGQRASSNYWMLDGVSANFGVSSQSTSPGNGVGGAIGSLSVLGGTNSLVSVDALQEFRIQTSTYAPEFGRTPGGQISIVTRSGTNQFHGTAFDYLRNDILDANNWFNALVTPPLPKAKERQNDFGGTVSGPILRDRTFFFFSYEGLRLRLPQTSLTTVPDMTARQSAVSAMQPYLNAFPLPNGPEVLDAQGNPTGSSQLNASYSNPASLDAYSIRVDDKLSGSVNLFGRYNYSPSEIVQRGPFAFEPLSTLYRSRITTQTATLGMGWVISPVATNDLRVNYSRANASSDFELDNFDGAVPLNSLSFPSPYTAQNSFLDFSIFSLVTPALEVGSIGRNIQRQFNLVDDLEIQRGSHRLKVGLDYRRLSPVFAPPEYAQEVFFFDVPSAGMGNPFESVVASNRGATLLFRNLGVFAQDTWRVVPRLTLTYGFRWDVDFVPTSVHGPALPAVTGFNLNDLSQLALAQPGAVPFRTRYGNIAPRVGVAYEISQSKKWQTVLRGGVGMFFDLATSEAGNLLRASYPFGANKINFGGNFPLQGAGATPPAITPDQLSLPGGVLSAFDPNLRLPYALEWNVALEQSLDTRQTISASYIGSVGRRLIQSAYLLSPNPNLFATNLVSNAATSDYNALQFQFQRRLSRGLQSLASYTWSHSIDDASAGSYGNGANVLVPNIANRGPSDFDIRNTLSVALTYDIPTLRVNAFTNAVVDGWSLENVILARSAPPVNAYEGLLFKLFGAITNVRPDTVPGQQFYLYGSRFPGGKAFNPAAFTPPPTDPTTGLPLRQGNLGRNALRGFGVAQWDFAVHRDFPIHDSLRLQFRAEMFNVLNHPNFAPPQSALGLPNFGQSTQMLGTYLGGNLGAGGFDPLYQVGGPRSIQLALKLLF